MPSKSLAPRPRILPIAVSDPMLPHLGGPPKTVAHRKVQRGHAVPQPKASNDALGPAGGPPEHVARGTTRRIEIRRERMENENWRKTLSEDSGGQDKRVDSPRAATRWWPTSFCCLMSSG